MEGAWNTFYEVARGRKHQWTEDLLYSLCQRGGITKALVTLYAVTTLSWFGIYNIQSLFALAITSKRMTCEFKLIVDPSSGARGSKTRRHYQHAIASSPADNRMGRTMPIMNYLQRCLGTTQSPTSTVHLPDDFKTNFRGKTAEIRVQHKNFWSYQSARADVDAYLYETEGYAFPTIDKWVMESTCFTNFNGIPFKESEHALLVGNFASFDTAQYDECPSRAGMSMVHLLCIPKANIFNAVSLDHTNVWIIDEMIALFKEAWAEFEVRSAVLRHQRDRIMARKEAQLAELSKKDASAASRRREKEIIEAFDAASAHWEELASGIHNLTAEDFEFGFHLYPQHSVSHLHLHIVAAPRKFRLYSTLANDAKTKDAIEVREFIAGLPSL
ncbi:hypothetical protein BX600DRAFT_431346 [Xylariales sp. PMI_506]|nr:hypothetical protein BX600DRAFT_431346 [Xylariales sp. PMI_506]